MCKNLVLNGITNDLYYYCNAYKFSKEVWYSLRKNDNEERDVWYSLTILIHNSHHIDDALNFFNKFDVL